MPSPPWNCRTLLPGRIGFGEDLVLYGIDWLNSDPLGTQGQVLGIMRDSFDGRSAVAREQSFRLNSKAENEGIVC